MRRLALLCALAAACGSSEDPCNSWRQWGGDPAHHGAVCVAGQGMTRQLARIFYDPFIEEEKIDGGNDILIHYQVPLVVGDDLYMMAKSGTYTPCDRQSRTCPAYYQSSQVWQEKGYRWEGEALVEKWMFASDWKPEPLLGFEPMFQPALVGDRLYVPGVGGSVHKLDRKTGMALARIQPFGATLDPDTYVASAVSADHDGNIYYAALKLDHDKPYSMDAIGWLVKITPDDKFVTKKYQDLALGAPAPTEMCRSVFTRMTPRPWPPPDDENGKVYPPSFPCLSQRPGINAAPAIAEDGTIFIVSRAHGNDRYGFIVALKPDLSVKWSRSLSKILNDGCGVLIADDGTADNPLVCRMGAEHGVDINTNEPPSARVTDSSSSSLVALPDGGVAYGSFTGYNGSRGHLVKVDAAGNVAGSFDFGWDTTPAIYRHDGSYSIILKENSYGRNGEGVDLGPFYITQLGPSLQMEWRYQAKNTQSCVRAEDGMVTCVDDHPNGFEWCINAPAVDKNGVVYANSEDGNVYAIGQGGVETGRFFMEMAVGAAYTPLALDDEGRLYTMNDGKLTVIGK